MLGLVEVSESQVQGLLNLRVYLNRRKVRNRHTERSRNSDDDTIASSKLSCEVDFGSGVSLSELYAWDGISNLNHDCKLFGLEGGIVEML